jgi:hypothetical protein
MTDSADSGSCATKEPGRSPPMTLETGIMIWKAFYGCLGCGSYIIGSLACINSVTARADQLCFRFTMTVVLEAS